MTINITKLICLVLAMFVAGSVGAESRWEKGYNAGYADGYEQGYKEAQRKFDQDYDSRTTSVETCGGGGVTLNKKHIPPGATGCVRVYSDGRYEQY